MANTPNLNLYKGTPGSATETFNVQTMLNDNWDKLDTGVQKKITVSNTAPLNPIDNELWLDTSTVPNMLNRYDASTTSWIEIGAILAADVSIQDAEGHFAADDVEGALHELFTNVSDGKTSIASAITDMGQNAGGGDTFAVLSLKIKDISKDANALAGDVLATKTFYQGGLKKTGTMPNRGVGGTVIPNTTNQTKLAGYYSSDITIEGDLDLVAGNIKNGSNIFGVAGKTEVVDTTEVSSPVSAGQILSGKVGFVNGAKVTGTIPSKGAETFTPSTINQTIALGQYLSGVQTILGDADLVAANIKAGASIFGVAGNANVVDTSLGTAIASDILSGKVAFVDGAQVTGTIPSKGVATITPSTTNQTIASGQYLSGTQTILGDADLIATNIKSGKNIFNVAGSLIEGKRWASGSATSGSNLSWIRADGLSRTAGSLEVGGLTFTASIIIVYLHNSSFTVYHSSPFHTNGSTSKTGTIWTSASIDSSGYTNIWNVLSLELPAYVNGTGFKLPVGTSGTFNWVAIE